MALYGYGVAVAGFRWSRGCLGGNGIAVEGLDGYGIVIGWFRWSRGGLDGYGVAYIVLGIP